MKNDWFRFLVYVSCGPVLVMLSTAAQASSVTLLLKGVINPGSYVYTKADGGNGNLDGGALSACVKFDPLSAPNQSGDGATYRQESSSTSPYVSVKLTLPGGIKLSTATGGIAAPELTQLYRNYANGNANHVSFNITNAQLFESGAYRTRFRFHWGYTDNLGESSTLFLDPNGGLAYDQPFNVIGSTPGEFDLFRMDQNFGASYHYRGSFQLISIRAVKRC